MSAKIKNLYLWKFFEFICSYRNPLFILLKPIIESTVSFNFVKLKDSSSSTSLHSICLYLACEHGKLCRTNLLQLAQLLQNQQILHF